MEQVAYQSTQTVQRLKPPSPGAFIAVLILLLCVTWGPLIAVHFSQQSLGDEETGTVVAVFPPHMSKSDVFLKIQEAGGVLLRPIDWLGNTLIVHSASEGFAGRLKEQGAWGRFAVDILDLSAILDCFSTIKS